VAGDQHPFVPPEFYFGIDRSVSRLRASGNRALDSKFMCGAEKSSLAECINERDHSKSACASKLMILQENNQFAGV
jgi:hypothetical protein